MLLILKGYLTMSKTNDCSVSSLFNKMRRKIFDMSVLSEISSNILIAEMIHNSNKILVNYIVLSEYS